MPKAAILLNDKRIKALKPKRSDTASPAVVAWRWKS
jgi:hypothetical protein